MYDPIEGVKQDLAAGDPEYLGVYCDSFTDGVIATQIKVLREQRGWTQKQLAERAGMAQERISVLEDVNYAAWSIRTLRRLAKAFGLRLVIRFEKYDTVVAEVEGFSRKGLQRP